MTQTYFQKGLGLSAEVGPALTRSYQSPVVDRLKLLGYEATAGEVRIRLAREFGFCYGVDRAVDYAYQARARFPDRRIFLAGEVIHNPDVNGRLTAMGICILPDSKDPSARYLDVGSGDVMILPAFGVTVAEMSILHARGCVLVDTTCGSVLNVWKMVHRSARDGFTIVIHGKHYHEETRATASQALMHDGRHYICVRDVAEAGILCAFVRGETPGAAVVDRFMKASSDGFDPERDLQRIGLANQTTMLMSESLEIQEMLRQALRDRYGEADLDHRFRAFDTICSATQDRQDAVLAMLDGHVDVMVVIGGYNSSNTQALARMCTPVLPTFHIDSADCVEHAAIRHRSLDGGAEVRTAGWLCEGPVTIGITAGASTPDSVVGHVLERILALRGYTGADLKGLPATAASE